jgi:hypothetical protein
MKTSKWFFVALIFSFMLVGCVSKPKNPMEGTWQMVYGDWMASDSTTYPASIEGGQIKTWTQWNVAFVGQFIRDGIKEDTYGAGRYVLNGNRYTERFTYHYQKYYRECGDLRLLVEFKGDTMIQRWPVDANWKLPKRYCMEKYVRIYK